MDPKVISQMIQFFAAAIPLANPQLLSELYDSAKASPLSSTKASLREDEALVFNGTFLDGTPSRCGLHSVLAHILATHMALHSCAHSLSANALHVVATFCVCLQGFAADCF